MNSGDDDCRRISRRAAVSGAALALGAAAIATAVPEAAAQQKISQADAQYQGTPKGGQHCDGCINFQSPKTCKFVQGDISPGGWCQLFTPKS
ncbi:MAG: high potential iron sulfur protein [Xanthobacteraceae bacterium]|nr:high potential iron sulfur protein [Xanthobacteraceae bacterium]